MTRRVKEIKGKARFEFDATQCAEEVLASGFICGGCKCSVICDISRKFNEMRKDEWEVRDGVR